MSQGDFHIHLCVADVVKSFDTVIRLGLPGWFWRVYLSYHAGVRLRFKLSCGLGKPWVRDGGMPQGCPLGMTTQSVYPLVLGLS